MSRKAAEIVTDVTVQQYQRDGVVILRDVFTEEELGLVAAGIDAAMASPSPRAREYGGENPGTNGFFYDACLGPDIREFETFAFHSPMAWIAANLMGSRTATAFYFTAFVRSPGCSTRTPWHRDQTGWCAAGEHGLSIWVSLEHVPRESALEFVLGSHLWEVNFKRKDFSAGGLGVVRDVKGLEDAIEVPDLFGADRAKHDIAGWAMKPGDCLAFHSKTLHGGAGDLPPGLGRRTLSTQWVGDDSQVVQPPGGADPDWTKELARHGVNLGDHPASVVSPRIWPPSEATVLPWRDTAS